jgi:hypothetical protein
MDFSLIDAGVSSVKLVAFAKLVAQESNDTFTPEDCADDNSVREFIEHLDTHAG